MSSRARAMAPMLLILLGSTAVRAEDVARLYRWAEPATLVANPGPGQSRVYLLIAEVGWQPSASRALGAYTMRLRLPNGEQTSHPVSAYEGPGTSIVTFQVPADAVRNVRPRDLTLKAWLADSATGQPVSRALKATVADFPNPSVALPPVDSGPFGWGTPLSETSRVLPNPSPDGTHFARIPRPGPRPASSWPPRS